MTYRMTWQNDLLTKWTVDKMTSWQNGLLTKWPLDKITCWQNGLLMEWHVDKMTCRQNDLQSTWPFDHNDSVKTIHLYKFSAVWIFNILDICVYHLLNFVWLFDSLCATVHCQMLRCTTVCLLTCLYLRQLNYSSFQIYYCLLVELLNCYNDGLLRC